MPVCRDSRGFEGTGRYVQRDPWPVRELGRTLLSAPLETDPSQWVPELNDLYAGYVMGQDGVFRTKNEHFDKSAEQDHETNLASDGVTGLLTEAATYDEGRAIIKSTLYRGTTARQSGDEELLRKLA
jgi:hypothetical protein